MMMNPILQMELHRLDHQERLQQAQQYRLARQFKTNNSFLRKLRSLRQQTGRMAQTQSDLKPVHSK